MKAQRAKAKTARARGEAEQLAAIHAEPDDVAARSVFADWLLERDDPRGEFIALQLARAAGQPGDHARERTLLAVHGPIWAGPLHDYFEQNDRIFERGFFAGGRVRPFEQRRLAAMMRAPGWRLITTLAGSTDQLRALVDRPELVSLRSVYGIGERFAAELAGGDRRAWTELAFEGHGENSRAPHDRRALAACKALPELRVLGVELFDDTHEWLCAATVIERIERLVVKSRHVDAEFLEAIAARGGKLRELVFEASQGPLMMPEGWVLTLRRESAPGQFTKLVARHRAGVHTSDFHLVWDLRSALAMLPAAWLHAIDIDTGRKLTLKPVDRAALAKEVKRFKNAKTVAVPWAPPAKPRRASGRGFDVTVLGASLLGKVAGVWKLVVEELGQHYDFCAVGHNSEVQPLGDRALEQVLKWAANKRTGWLELSRDGGRGTLVLSQNLGGLDSPTRVQLGGVDQTNDQLVDWFARFLDQAELTTGTFDLAGERFGFDDFNLRELGGPRGGWLLYFGGAFAELVPAKQVAKLSARRDLAGVFVRATKHGVIVGAAATPEAVTKRRLGALADALRVIIAGNLPKLHGYDLVARARAVLEPVARELGMKYEEPVEATTVVFVKRGKPEQRLIVEQQEPLAEPYIGIQLESGPRDHCDNHWLTPRMEMPATTRAQLDKHLVAAAKRARAEAPAWLAKARAPVTRDRRRDR